MDKDNNQKPAEEFHQVEKNETLQDPGAAVNDYGRASRGAGLSDENEEHENEPSRKNQENNPGRP